MKILSCLVLLALESLDTARGFAPSHQTHHGTAKYIPHSNNVLVGEDQPLSTFQQKTRHLPVIQAKNTDVVESDEQTPFWNDLSINPPYVAAYVLFLSFAFYRSFTEPEGASMEILQGFFVDPINPGCNELFVAIFNLLGLYFVPLACLLMPGAKGQKLPATPFIFASMLGGYGFLGPYVMTREPSFSVVKKSDLGWFTSKVLENKIFNWVTVALILSAYINSGCIGALVSDPNGLISGYGDLASQTAIASASSMDFAILTLVAASFVPEDLARRGVQGGIAPYAIAASTVLLPGVGAALYCALRPPLDEE
ncbi:hypothetical protein HJC23_002340 [Cyclotella cryptica]|uniref:Uncharacterized protein n=1 Tax=Cyclotella cryptica TaxID=29204 RepID=A0ABD3QLD9_9STRA|eukprot:CCRYP_004421-RA/>CCRYP_004421-RA protein AED:0.03 eAED:0.03 QI:121/1/1/1/1/1/2/104/310